MLCSRLVRLCNYVTKHYSVAFLECLQALDSYLTLLQRSKMYNLVLAIPTADLSSGSGESMGYLASYTH